MRILGWIGTILCAPFYFLFFAMDKLRVLYWIPVGTGVYGAWLILLSIKSILEDSVGAGIGAFVFNIAILGIFLAFLIFVGWILWYLLFTANNIVYILVNLLITPFVYGFTYCNAWRQGMSKYELEGKLACIQHEKEVRKQEIKSRQEAKKAEKERKKQEQYEKGYQSQQAKRTGNQQNTEQQYYGYEDSPTGQQNQSGKYHSMDTDYASALSLFMLEEGYTLDDLKKQRNRLMKSFHPDEKDAETARYAQKINSAYVVLKNRMCA